MLRTCPIVWGMAVVVAAGVGTSAHGQQAGVDPGARELLSQVAAAYRGLAGYEDHGAFTVRLKRDGVEVGQEQPMAVAWKAPGNLALDAGAARLVSDGKTVTHTIVPTKRYLSVPAPARLAPAVVADSPAGSLLAGGAAAVPFQVLLSLLLDTDPVPAILAGGTGLNSAPDVQRGGKTYQVLELIAPSGTRYGLWVDPETRLLQRIELVPDAENSDKAITDLSIAWDAGSIVTSAPEAARFAYQTPGGFERVRDVSEDAPEGKAEAPRHPLLGQNAPEFTLTLLGDEEKPQRLSRDELKGKVVVIDFWATWCPPCLKELPEIAALVEELAAWAPDVVVIAASQDREGADEKLTPTELVRRTIEDKKLALARPPVGLVAIDPTMALGQAFQVEALPTIVVIDRQGVIQAVHVGYVEEIRATLKRQVEDLLAGKSLLEAKPAAEQDGEAGK